MSEPLISEFDNEFDEDMEFPDNFEELQEHATNKTENVAAEVNAVDIATNDIAADVDGDDDDDDEEEEITAQKVLEYLEIAWRNEIAAPEILPHQSDMLELMLGQMAHMEKNLKGMPRNDFRAVIHRMEIERIRYIIASYLRCRLNKIETFTRHILDEDAALDIDNKRLSVEETIYANEYYDNQESYFHQVALQHIPTMQRSADDEQRVVRPNLMSHVFVKANVTVPAVIVGADDEEVDLAVGSQHIIPYQLIANLVKTNQAQLI